MDQNKKRIVFFLIYYFVISIAILLIFYFFLPKFFWFLLFIWLLATFGVVAVSFFTFANLRIQELEKKSKENNDDRD